MKFVYAKDLDKKSRRLVEARSLEDFDKFPIFESVKEMKKYEAFKFEQPKMIDKLAKKLFDKASEEEKYHNGTDYVYNKCEKQAKTIIYNKMKKISENMIEKAQNLDNKFYMVVGETNISFHDTIDYIRACFEDKKVAEEFIKNQKDKTLHIVEDNGYLKNHQEELSF